ncbi:DUF4954 family protein [Puteibacter caeruleilacunae]|nr:DUF4954 family protein [Puteibacter caeruleilacunae]
MENRTLTKATFRKLTNEDIGQLVMQGCSSEDWTLIEVTDDFIPDRIRNSNFSGHVRLGKFDETITLFGGIRFETGIYNARLHNCNIGDNVLIYNVNSYIANYNIAPRAVIHNINQLAVEGKCAFGNGTRVQTINEGGGREIPIYDHLSAHMAYILSLYRHRVKVIEKLESLVQNYVSYITDTKGYIGYGAHIINCENIRNVKIGPHASLEGVCKLQNGSINSTKEDPISIGHDVIMDDFIISSGSKVMDATLVSHCFIGQGCILDKHYSAENSLFFANCQGFHGEACSIFAGPYTVTHHKSTLLIAGLFSFLNAGSGSNQSNHLYKLGPLHQGILERGAKTTSNSYILWPSRVGAFSLVMGRHYKHSDTSDFPFSYLIESKDESILAPAVNLKSIGTIRDTQKWPKRDNRKDPNKLDHINFNLLSPYTVQKMLNGIKLLNDIESASGKSAEEYSYQGLKIKRSALKKGIELYKMAIWKFLGNSLITRLQNKNPNSNERIREILKPDTPIGTGQWIDLSGLICPAKALKQLLNAIEESSIQSLEEADAVLKSIHDNYYNYEWTWASNVFTEFYGKSIEEFTVEDVIIITENWKKSVLEIDRLLYADAQKEFSMLKRTGFGVDGGEEVKELDFEVVRGEFETNDTVKAIKEHMTKKENLGNDVIARMQEIIDIQKQSN